MKRIITKSLAFIVAMFAFASCETYKVADPQQTAVGNMDGRYICFAYDEADPATPVTMFEIEATNTAFNAKDEMLFTIVDFSQETAFYDIEAFPEAVRFRVSCDTKAMTFNCTKAPVEVPNLVLNRLYYPVLYTQYYGEEMPWFYNDHMECSYVITGEEPDYKVTIEDGVVTPNSVSTASGYKADGISFKYIREHESGEVDTFIIKGMYITGWNEDMKVYNDWICEEWGMTSD